MYYVYVLQSKRDKKLYYGFTGDIERRLQLHNKGIVKSSKYRKPFKIVYYEKVKSKEDAIRKERYFKSGYGRKYIKRRLRKRAPSSNG